MEFQEFTSDQYAEMVEIAQPVYDSVRAAIGDEVIDSLLASIS